MKTETLGRVIRLGFTNFWRNRWLSLAATLIMTITLIVISLSFIFNVAISSTTTALTEKIDLSVYFNDEISEEKILDFKNLIDMRSDVKSAEYVSKEEAYQIWLGLKTPDKIKNLISLEENPLPRSLEIKAVDPDRLDNIANFITQSTYKDSVRSVSYQRNKDLIRRLVSITNFTKKLGWGLSIFFIAIAILVIFNTIRLTIFTRRDEIEIMRLVGASDIFIRIPFLLEGILYGLIAALLALLLLAGGIHLISPAMNRYLGEGVLDLSGFFRHYFWLIAVLEFSVGVVISAFCSLLAVRNYLKK